MYNKKKEIMYLKKYSILHSYNHYYYFWYLVITKVEAVYISTVWFLSSPTLMVSMTFNFWIDWLLLFDLSFALLCY